MKVPFCNLRKVNGGACGVSEEELSGAYFRVMVSGQYILGQEVDWFERKWAAACDKRYAVGCGNAFDGLCMMLRAYGVGPGGEVIVPSNTYIATWLAVTAVGAKVVPVEPDPMTSNIDPSRVVDAITSHTRAILAVHLYGRPAPMSELRALADEYDVRLLVDAAQAHGISGEQLGDAAVFSFYPTKNLGALGDGGAVVTDDLRVAERVRSYRNYGAVEKDVHKDLGANSRLDELQAAFLNAKLPYLPEMNRLRALNAAIYYSHGIAPPKNGSVWHQFVIHVENRDAFRVRMAEQGVETMVHYPIPPHLQKAYGGSFGQYPIAERLARQAVSLPIGPELTVDQVRYAARTAREFLLEKAA